MGRFNLLLMWLQRPRRQSLHGASSRNTSSGIQEQRQVHSFEQVQSFQRQQELKQEKPTQVPLERRAKR